MNKLRQDDQLEPIYNSSVLIQNVALKTSRERWTIETGGGRESGTSMLMAWYDDDGDYIYASNNSFKNLIVSLKKNTRDSDKSWM